MATEWLGDDGGFALDLSGCDGIAKMFPDKTLISFSLKPPSRACGERVVVITYCGKQPVPGRITVEIYEITQAQFANQKGWEIGAISVAPFSDGDGMVLTFRDVGGVAKLKEFNDAR